MIQEQTATQKVLKKLQAGFDPGEPIPKYYQIKRIIKSQILNGSLKPGEKLPSVYMLAEEFNITRVTADKSLDELERENLVRRIQGRGTFVCETTAPLTAGEIVGLIMPASGHVYQPLAENIIRGINQDNLFCLVINLDPEDNLEQKIEILIDKKPGILIIDGFSSFPFHLLDNFSGNVIFIDRCETDKRYPATYILSDYRAGGRIAAEHLCGHGHDKIFFLTYKMLPYHIAQQSLIAGAHDALREHNLPENRLIIVDRQHEQKIPDILKKEPKPVAFFIESDSRAPIVYETAKKLHLRIPEDIRLVGYYNTPWCEKLTPHLSSVSIREDEIAAKAVESIACGANKKEEIIIEPELVIRDSCYARGHK